MPFTRISLPKGEGLADYMGAFAVTSGIGLKSCGLF